MYENVAAPVTYRHFDRCRVALAALAGTGLALVAGLGTTQSPPPIVFTDVADRSGIDFIHHNGAAGNYLYPELFGGGVAVLDIDSDGWPDLLFVNGKDWQPGGRRARHGLFRNNRDGTFGDAIAGSGLDAVNVYGMGAAIADYDKTAATTS